MLRHVVFFKLKEPTQENLDQTKEVLMGLEGKIPELLSIEVGIDIVRSERSYDLVLITTFDSLDAMKAYQVHPLHVEVLDYIAKVRDTVLAVDYEF